MKKIIKKKWVEFATVFGLLIIASIPRLLILDQIPQGLHGDEAWTGLDAKRIINEGIIEPYVDSAWGQPTGPLYVTAFFLTVFGESITSLRASMAFLGILTIPFLYLFLRQFFNYKPSLLATIAFGFSLFHIHFSRIAFMLISSPLLEIISLSFLFKGFITGKKLFFLLSGLFLGLGMHTYNTFPTLAGSVFLITFIEFFVTKRKKQYALNLLLFFAIFLLTAESLLRLMIFQPEYYFGHHRQSSSIFRIYESKEYMKNTIELLGHGVTKTRNYFTGFEADYGDGHGSIYNIEYPYILFALGGLLIALKKPNRFAMYVLAMLCISLSPLLLTSDGLYRRQVLSLPLIYFFVAFFFQKILSIKKRFIMYILLLVIVIQSGISLYFYFMSFSKTPVAINLFLQNETRAAQGARLVYDGDDYVLWYSDLWNCRYESVRYLVGFTECEDRNYKTDKSLLYHIDRQRNILFILIPPYLAGIDAIKTKYPGGSTRTILDEKSGKISVIFYKIN